MKKMEIELPEGCTEWSGEVLTEMTDSRKKFHDQLFPDLPNGRYRIKAIGYAVKVGDDNELQNA